MKRQIKFRAMKDGRLRYSDEFTHFYAFYESVACHEDDTDQFTGLLDANGREIYEGDIILSQKKTREVKFGEFWNGEDICNGFFLQDSKIKHRNFGCSKIIGNVHQP